MPKTDEQGVDWFNEDDLAQSKGFANEPNFDRFVERLEGCRLDELHSQTEFQNVDYVFSGEKVLVELKTLETEVGNTHQFREKMKVLHGRVFAKHGKTPLSLDPTFTSDYLKGFIELYRPPLARIIKKANAQIRSTKKNFSYDDYKGVLLLVNDNLKELPPRFLLATLGRILNGSCSSIRALIYLTNHYVIIPGDEYGRVLWVPMYADEGDDELVDFVNKFGKSWFDYCEELGQPSDDRRAGPDISIAGARAAGSRFPIA